MTTVIVVDRSEVMARGIKDVLAQAGCNNIVLSRSEDELRLILPDHQPELVLFGRGLPSSAIVMSEIMNRAPAARGLSLRDWIESSDVLRLTSQRILGILHPNAGLPKYRACISSVRENCPWIDPELLYGVLQQHKKATDLTSREVEIIDMVQRGWRNKQIAHGLGITEGTVKMHLHHIFTKLRLATRTQLALAAVQVGSDRQKVPVGLANRVTVEVERFSEAMEAGD